MGKIIKILTVFVLAIACVTLQLVYPEWRSEARAQGYTMFPPCSSEGACPAEDQVCGVLIGETSSSCIPPLVVEVVEPIPPVEDTSEDIINTLSRGDQAVTEATGEELPPPPPPEALPPPPPIQLPPVVITVEPSFGRKLANSLKTASDASWVLMGAAAAAGRGLALIPRATASSLTAAAVEAAGFLALTSFGLHALSAIVSQATELFEAEPEIGPVAPQSTPLLQNVSPQHDASPPPGQPVITAVLDATTGERITAARAGTPIVLLGSFNARSRTGNKVFFGSQEELAFTSSASQILTSVPPVVSGNGGPTGDNIVIETAENVRSDPFPFEALPLITPPTPPDPPDRLAITEFIDQSTSLYRDLERLNCRATADEVFPSDELLDERAQFLDVCELLRETARKGIAALQTFREKLNVVKAEERALVETIVAPSATLAIAATRNTLLPALDPGGDGIPKIVEAVFELVTCGGLLATFVGTPGDDLLIGTPGPDVIHGLGGSDVIYGLAGDDVICSGSGDDS